MSTLYNLEPQPTAKVILKTTSGDLALELFAKQTPLASRNFLQHCLDGYYDNTIFHRLVPGFILQGGDPTGTGAGGVSAIGDGAPFEDEFHSRLKFNRRGLLGMANEGKDSNASQFFLTLGPTPELQGKNTMFGRIEGDTIYNLMKMAETELIEGEGSERPLYPVRIIETEILVKFFDDMVARVRQAPRQSDQDAKQSAKKRKKPAGKNVLSFGAEDGGDEVAMPVLKRPKANPKLVSDESEVVEHRPDIKKTSKPRMEHTTEDSEPAPQKRAPDSDQDEGDDDNDSDDKRAAPPKPKPNALETTNAEIAALKASMKRRIDTKPKEPDRPKNALEEMIPVTATRGRKRGKLNDEKGAMDVFKAFKQRLDDLPPSAGMDSGATNGRHVVSVPEINARKDIGQTAAEADDDDDEAALCDLHFIAYCQSCRSWDDEKTEESAIGALGDEDAGWMAHTLSFAKDTLGKDLEWKRKMMEIEVIDPREKAKAIQAERKRGRAK